MSSDTSHNGWQKPLVCPNCGSKSIARIQWGRPAWSEDLRRKLEAGSVVLGGCSVSVESRRWRCRSCRYEFGDFGIRAWIYQIKHGELPDYMAAHGSSYNNRKEVLRSGACGCFHCGQIYSSRLIGTWAPGAEGETAVCPFCGVDSVIGDASGLPITKEFLGEMHDYWF